nr:PIN domain-containing protein [Halomarina salina]
MFRGDDGAFRVGVDLRERNVVQRVPAPVVAELSYGVAIEGTDEERRRFENAMAMYPVTAQTRELARDAGELLARADRDAGGESGVGMVDAMVAAVGDAVGEPILTDNIRDFERLGVETESY